MWLLEREGARALELSEKPLTIGRDTTDNDSDRTISREHAELWTSPCGEGVLCKCISNSKAIHVLQVAGTLSWRALKPNEYCLLQRGDNLSLHGVEESSAELVFFCQRRPIMCITLSSELLHA